MVLNRNVFARNVDHDQTAHFTPKILCMVLNRNAITSSVDHDQAAHNGIINEQSDNGLHCLRWHICSKHV